MSVCVNVLTSGGQRVLSCCWIKKDKGYTGEQFTRSIEVNSNVGFGATLQSGEHEAILGQLILNTGRAGADQTPA